MYAHTRAHPHASGWPGHFAEKQAKMQTSIKLFTTLQTLF